MSRGLELAVVFGAALLLLCGVVVYALLQQRRAVQARLAATRSFAASLRDALAIGASLEPAREPFREGMWAIAGVLRGRPLRVRVGAGVVMLDVQLPGAAGAGWDLVPTREFAARGGLHDDPEDPSRRLDPAALGVGWSVRGQDAERKAGLLSPTIRALLRADAATPPWIVDGWLRIGHAGDDVAAAAEWIRVLIGQVVS